MSSPANARAGLWLLLGLGAVLAVFLALPPLALLWQTRPQDLAAGLAHPLVHAALRLSALTTLISLVLVVVLGTPLAWLLARSQSRAARAVETLVQLPIVLPPAVGGLALLFAFGRYGLLAGIAYPRGTSLAFTTGAVIMAEVFVSAPFFVQAAVAAFRSLDPNLVLVARSFGASPLTVFLKVGVPLASQGLLAGAAMSWARSLGEFGATLMFAGNLQGRTQTLPLAIYTSFESDMRAAQALSLVLLVLAFLLLFIMRSASRRARAGAASLGS